MVFCLLGPIIYVENSLNFSILYFIILCLHCLKATFLIYAN